MIKYLFTFLRMIGTSIYLVLLYLLFFFVSRCSCSFSSFPNTWAYYSEGKKNLCGLTFPIFSHALLLPYAAPHADAIVKKQTCAFYVRSSKIIFRCLAEAGVLLTSVVHPLKCGFTWPFTDNLMRLYVHWRMKMCIQYLVGSNLNPMGLD